MSLFMNWFRILWLVGLLFAASDLAAVSADDLCPICGKRFGKKVFAITKRGRDEKVVICADCMKLETTCYICGVPVKDKFLSLADGRLLCEEDARQAVLTQDDA